MSELKPFASEEEMIRETDAIVRGYHWSTFWYLLAWVGGPLAAVFALEIWARWGH